MKILNLLFSSILGVVCWACSSPAPSTSSSSHWITCKTLDDCRSLSNAAACTAGYCVDSMGARVALTSTSRSCDPLAVKELPVTLGTVLGVGSDTNGTTYLADEVSSPTTTDRVFVSSGKSLFRKRVVGSGSSGSSDYTFSFEGDSGSVALLIHRSGGEATAMALGPGGKGFIGDPGAVTTMLTVEDPGVLSGFTLRNLPGEVTIEYVADVEDGSVIVVTHPAVDYDYTDFRMFYGQPSKLEERRVTNTSRAKSGSTIMAFDVGGATYTASFPWVMEFAPDGGSVGHPGNGTLDKGNGTTLDFTQRLPTPTTLPDLSFTCL